MNIAALIAWLLTATGGSLLAGIWLVKGGLRKPRTSRFSPAVVFGHAGLAAVGLLVYVGFLVTDQRGYAWLALAVLVPVAALGATLFFGWLPPTHPIDVQPNQPPRPEAHIPLVLALAHGAGALVTVVLVLLAAGAAFQ